MSEHLVKIADTVKFLGVYIDKDLNMKQHIEHIERTSLISRKRITRLNSVNATLLICVYKIFTRPYMDRAYIALTNFNKPQRQIRGNSVQNHCLRYARRAVDSTCISIYELRSRLEQRILALAEIW